MFARGEEAKIIFEIILFWKLKSSEQKSKLENLHSVEQSSMCEFYRYCKTDFFSIKTPLLSQIKKNMSQYCTSRFYDFVSP